MEKELAYNPDDIAHRTCLATELHTMLSTSGFAKLDGHGEDVYEYKAVGGVCILVYSSIVGEAVRGDGEDAIRVAAIYRRKDGQVRGLFKDTRVNRTGEIHKIVDRTKERMRGAYVAVRDRLKSGLVCNYCGAPLFTAKSGKDTCAETCWLTKGTR